MVWLPTDLGPGPGAAAGDDETLDDEPVRGLEEQDVLHPALVEERPDRAEDLFEILARATLVDPHAVGASSRSDA